jgi:single-strand DNA-binding protein
MANYNKVILLGNLTRDPQMSYLPSQTPVVEFGLAVNRRWRGQTGEQREETCFVDCRCYGKQAETFNQYMAKGRTVLIEGRLQLDTWEGKDGTKRSKHRIFVERFQFIGGGQAGAGGQGGGQAGGQAPRSQPGRKQEGDVHEDQEVPPNQYEDEGGGDEIPF